MLVPGIVVSGGRFNTTRSAGQVPDLINEGIGLMNDGSLAIDTNAVVGTNTDRGFAQNATGALYGTTATAGSDVWIEGLRVTNLGAIVFEVGAATQVVNGNPLTVNAVLSVN